VDLQAGIRLQSGVPRAAGLAECGQVAYGVVSSSPLKGLYVSCADPCVCLLVSWPAQDSTSAGMWWSPALPNHPLL
jgi:hypothetical protein